MSALTFKDQAFLASTRLSFNPASLSGLYRWYKADSFNGIAVNGDAIGGGTNQVGPWVDQTGSGDDANRPSNGPGFITPAVGTMPIIRFGSVIGPHLNFAPGLLGDFTIIAASAATADPSFILFAPHQLTRRFSGANVIRFYAGGVLVDDSGLSGAATDFFVTVVRRSGGTVTLRQNKTSVGGGIEAAAFDVTQIGNSALGSDMDLGELMIWTTAHSDADVDKLYDQYLKPRWVTLP